MSRHVTIPTPDGRRVYFEPQWLTVRLFRTWYATPTFHASRDFDGFTDGERRGWQVKTRCGREIEYADWIRNAPYEAQDRHERSASGIDLPLRHAISFGRPCARCWP